MPLAHNWETSVTHCLLETQKSETIRTRNESWDLIHTRRWIQIFNPKPSLMGTTRSVHLHDVLDQVVRLHDSHAEEKWPDVVAFADTFSARSMNGKRSVSHEHLESSYKFCLDFYSWSFHNFWTASLHELGYSLILQVRSSMLAVSNVPAKGDTIAHGSTLFSTITLSKFWISCCVLFSRDWCSWQGHA